MQRGLKSEPPPPPPLAFKCARARALEAFEKALSLSLRRKFATAHAHNEQANRRPVRYANSTSAAARDAPNSIALLPERSLRAKFKPAAEPKSSARARAYNGTSRRANINNAAPMIG